MYTNDTQPSDLIGLANDCRHLRNTFECMPKLERMKHAALVHKLNQGGKQWKRQLMLAANYFPKKASFPYGEQAAKG